MRGLVRALRPLGRLARLLPHARAASVLTAPWRVVTPTGVAAGVLLAACVAAGWVLGWQEAWSAAVVLAVVVCTAWLWLLPSGGHQVSHSPLSSKVTVGDHALVHVEVTNPLTRSLLPTRMELPIGGGTAVFAVPTLAPRASFERGFVLPTDHRGVVTVGPVLCVARDPVGLLRRERERTRAQRIHVHPRTLLMGAVLQGVLRDVEGAVTQDLSSSDVSFHALRDYVPGDDRRNVHWRTTARVGRLMVRQFEETRRSSLMVPCSRAGRSACSPPGRPCPPPRPCVCWTPPAPWPWRPRATTCPWPAGPAPTTLTPRCWSWSPASACPWATWPGCAGWSRCP